MVSWTNLFPLDPPGGALVAFGRAAPSSLSEQAWGYYNIWRYFASPGAVDTNIGTRIQYLAGDDTPGNATNTPTVWGAFIFDAADEAGRGTLSMTGSIYIAPASAFGAGVVPSISQIRANAVSLGRLNSGRTTAGSLKTAGYAMLTAALRTPNTKYWVALVPSYADMAAPVTTTSDTPIGDINVNGRAMSIWTNRTPLAPKILSPENQTRHLVGSSISLSYEPQGSDRIASFPTDGGPNDLDDLAGVQIQYAPQPTEENPDPEWVDLPLYDGTIAPFVAGDSWYIDGKDVDVPPGWDIWNYGSYVLWRLREIPIVAGGNPGFTASSAYLPSGDWQVRLRTFDYGHPIPNSTDLNPWIGANGRPALAGTVAPLTPESMPATNTSPWSEPVYISVSEAIPKPLAISPRDSIAVVGNEFIPLVWQYRTGTAFESNQAHRLVQIRKLGDVEWTTLADDDSSSSTFVIGSESLSGYTPVSGNAYQWRVQVADEWYSLTSEFSDPATFWVVPVPESGEVIPVPGDTIDGSTLGCGTHHVMVYRRGGKRHVGEINKVSRIEWNRMRDEISDAQITVTGWDIDCGNLLSKLEPWAYEIVLIRDNGYSQERVWEGPITLLTYEVDKVTIHAKDVMAYAYRRIIKQAMSDSGNSPTAGRSVVARATEVLQNVFAPDDPNVLAYLTPISQVDDAVQYRSLAAYSRTGYEEVDDMAANAGLDYTAVGRRILLWGTKHRIGTLPEFRDSDLGNKPIVSVYGMSMANRYVVSDGNGVWGEATRLDANGEDETYGLVEMLSSTWSSESASEEGTYTQAGIETVSASFAESAERSIASRYPVPVVVRVPDNTRVNPDAVISVQHLVPGVVIPLRSVSTLRTVRANQKLDAVKCVEENGDEVITITMSPFSRDDTAVEEVV